MLRASSPPAAPPLRPPSPPHTTLAAPTAPPTPKTDSVSPSPWGRLSTAKTTLKSQVVAACWARYLEVGGSPGRRPRRAVGEGVARASRPPEHSPLLPPSTPSQVYGVHPPDFIYASAQVRITLIRSTETCFEPQDHVFRGVY
nr:wiskott-Aldrich syndrome protein family member 1-like [Procambarus clarkii]